MKKKALTSILLAGVFLIANCSAENPEPNQREAEETTVSPATIRIAAFNIQIFGKAKRGKQDVMDILERIAREFDVMLVQEIRDASETTADFYLAGINEMEGPDYAYVRSERLGRTSSKEAYAYFYNTETVQFIEDSDFVYDDMADGVDDFEREPYIASFRSGNFDFTLAGIHTKPDDAESEISELAEVYDSILAKNPGEKDVIIMGDFNADGSYFDEDGASPFMSSDYNWLISNDMDTMTKTDWTYDRIVMTDATFSTEYVADSAKVFYFDEEYGIASRELVEDVSDHYPVYAEFRIDMTDDDSPKTGLLPQGTTALAAAWGDIKQDLKLGSR